MEDSWVSEADPAVMGIRVQTTEHTEPECQQDHRLAQMHPCKTTC